MSERLLVACLCAEWCGSCREYRAVFDAVAGGHAGSATFAWVDIEDRPEVLGDVEVESFPSLLIARGDEIVFYGSVTPQPGTLSRLVERALAGDLGSLSVPALEGVTRRILPMSP